MNDEVSLLKKKIAHMQEEMEYLQYQLKGMKLTYKEKNVKPNSIIITEKDTSAPFDEIFYVTTYPDVAKVNIPPYEHYIKYGKKMGRRASR